MDIEKMALRVASDGPTAELTKIIGLHERLSDVLSAFIEAVQGNVDIVEADGTDPAIVELMQEQAGVVSRALQSVLVQVDEMDDRLAEMA